MVARRPYRRGAEYSQRFKESKVDVIRSENDRVPPIGAVKSGLSSYAPALSAGVYFRDRAGKKETAWCFKYTYRQLSFFLWLAARSIVRTPEKLQKQEKWVGL
jgi:hypothetical protein